MLRLGESDGQFFSEHLAGNGFIHFNLVSDENGMESLAVNYDFFSVYATSGFDISKYLHGTVRRRDDLVAYEAVLDRNIPLRGFQSAIVDRSADDNIEFQSVYQLGRNPSRDNKPLSFHDTAFLYVADNLHDGRQIMQISRRFQGYRSFLNDRGTYGNRVGFLVDRKESF